MHGNKTMKNPLPNKFIMNREKQKNRKIFYYDAVKYQEAK